MVTKYRPPPLRATSPTDAGDITNPPSPAPPAPQVMGLTTAIGVLQGTNSPMFAIALVFSLIVSRAGLLGGSVVRLGSSLPQRSCQPAPASGSAGAGVAALSTRLADCCTC